MTTVALTVLVTLVWSTPLFLWRRGRRVLAFVTLALATVVVGVSLYTVPGAVGNFAYTFGMALALIGHITAVRHRPVPHHEARLVQHR